MKSYSPRFTGCGYCQVVDRPKRPVHNPWTTLRVAHSLHSLDGYFLHLEKIVTTPHDMMMRLVKGKSICTNEKGFLKEALVCARSASLGGTRRRVFRCLDPIPVEKTMGCFFTLRY